ncbi:MAG: hypothetical protein ACFB10_21460 [Salibacteraceae bacterium]
MSPNGTEYSEPIFPFLAKHRKKLFWGTLLIWVMAFVFLQFLRVNRYEASIHCYVTGNKVTRPELLLKEDHRQDVVKLITSTEINNLLNFAVSDTVLHPIIDEYDLVGHYQIREADPIEARLFALDLLFRSYTVERTDENVVIFSLVDKDKDLAMKVLRDIFKRTQALNRAYYLGQIDRKQKVCTDQLEYYYQQKRIWEDSLRGLNFIMGNDFRALKNVFGFERNQPLNDREREIVKAMNQSEYALLQIDVFNKRIEYFENRSYQNRISRELILENKPVRLREFLGGHLRYRLFNSLLWSLVWAANALFAGAILLVFLFLYGDYLKALFRPTS